MNVITILETLQNKIFGHNFPSVHLVDNDPHSVPWTLDTNYVAQRTRYIFGQSNLMLKEAHTGAQEMHTQFKMQWGQKFCVSKTNDNKIVSVCACACVSCQ